MEIETVRPFEFTLPALWADHYRTWELSALRMNDYYAQIYHQWAENWLENAPNWKLTNTPYEPVVQPPPALHFIEHKDATGNVTSEPSAVVGPDLVCAPDPRIEAFLHPPVLPVDLIPHVGPAYAGNPNRFFAWDAAGVDRCPVGTVIFDATRGKLVRRADPGPVPEWVINYWEKVA